MERKSDLFKRNGALVLCLIVGAMVAGCGGGGSGSGSTAATQTDVQKYIADQQGGGFVGGWSGSSTGATAFERTLDAATAPNTYPMHYIDLTYDGTSWSVNPGPRPGFDLGTAGWIAKPSTATLVDNGDGTHLTITPTGDDPIVYALSRTAGTGGADSYTLIQSADSYYMYPNTAGTEATDASGVPLTALPVLGDTVCVTLGGQSAVFQPITATIAPGDNNYYVYWIGAGGCTAATITTALATPVADTVLVSSQSTGNGAVPTVMLVTRPYNLTPLNMAFLSLNAGSVWSGVMIPAGDTSTRKNKTVINGELTTAGIAVLP